MPDLLARQRVRLTRTLFASVALGTTSLYAAFTAAPLVAKDLGVSNAWTGIPGAASVLGAAIGSALLSSLMARRGRRAGLVLGWGVGVAGAFVAVVSVAGASFEGLLVGMVLVGIGHASNQLARFAAADMAPAARRASVLGWVVWASTIGAALGPSLLPAARDAADSAGVSPLAGGFLVALLFYAAALGCGSLLRPDPREVADEDTTAVEGSADLGAMWRMAHVQIALVILVIAQVAMVLVMTMTPIHIREHGHGLGVVGIVMSSHFIGMFAFAPPIGKLVGRFSTAPAALCGMAILIAAAVAAGLGSAESSAWMSASLFLLGLGWCFSFVAGSALLTRGLAYRERVRLQGRVDGVVWLSSAAASLASGLVLQAFGFAALSLVGAALVVGPLMLVAAWRATIEPAAA